MTSFMGNAILASSGSGMSNSSNVINTSFYTTISSQSSSNPNLIYTFPSEYITYVALSYDCVSSDYLTDQGVITSGFSPAVSSSVAMSTGWGVESNYEDRAVNGGKLSDVSTCRRLSIFSADGTRECGIQWVIKGGRQYMHILTHCLQYQVDASLQLLAQYKFRPK